MVAIKKCLATVATLLFTLTALANPSGSRRIQLTDTVVVSGVTIQPGSYTLSWSRESGCDNLSIAIARGKHVLATATGRWVESATPSPYEAVLYQTGHGMNELAGILFEHSPESIQVDAAATLTENCRDPGSIAR